MAIHYSNCMIWPIGTCLALFLLSLSLTLLYILYIIHITYNIHVRAYRGYRAMLASMSFELASPRTSLKLY